MVKKPKIIGASFARILLYIMLLYKMLPLYYKVYFKYLHIYFWVFLLQIFFIYIYCGLFFIMQVLHFGFRF